MRCARCDTTLMPDATSCEACGEVVDRRPPSRRPPREDPDLTPRDGNPPTQRRERPSGPRRRPPASGARATNAAPPGAPRRTRRSEPAPEEALSTSGEPGLEGQVCREHPRMPAATTCRRCGRFVCVRCVPDFLTTGESTCPECLEKAVYDAPGIGGWLILPAIGLVLWPVVEVMLLLWVVNADMPEQMDITVPIALLATDLLATVIVAVFFFQKKKVAPLMYIGLVALRLVVDLVTSSKGINWGTMLWSAIWVTYFLVSDRVRRTFVVD